MGARNRAGVMSLPSMWIDSKSRVPFMGYGSMIAQLITSWKPLARKPHNPNFRGSAEDFSLEKERTLSVVFVVVATLLYSLRLMSEET
jgi:hypothetical protein